MWGFEYSEIYESVRYDFCRRITGLSSKLVLLGEMGRYPLALHYFQRCIKYWLKVIQIPTARYPHVCYQMIYRLHNNGRHTWATEIALLLTKFGFQHVWAQQGVGNEDVFLSVMFTIKKSFKIKLGGRYQAF